jgi:hypothetical protein
MVLVRLLVTCQQRMVCRTLAPTTLLLLLLLLLLPTHRRGTIPPPSLPPSLHLSLLHNPIPSQEPVERPGKMKGEIFHQRMPTSLHKLHFKHALHLSRADRTVTFQQGVISEDEELGGGVEGGGEEGGGEALEPILPEGFSGAEVSDPFVVVFFF